ncbi:SIR2 family protein [Rhodococcus sp. M8-35]|uniref:SIR2 family protein n=1 Tax=Rhodococcus sp. M8-35 TaxID=3058401 RepID=UPI002ED5EEE5
MSSIRNNALMPTNRMISGRADSAIVTGAGTGMSNKNAELRDALASSLRDHTALPFLFIGSGLSRRYLGLPDWEGMLRHFADEIDADLDFILATTSNNMPKAASHLAKEFHPVWWKDRRYARQRKEFKATVRDEERAFKVAVAEYFRERSDLSAGAPGVDNGEYALEVAHLRNAVVDGIITTNYDKLVEQLFPHFPVYVGQGELLLSDAQFVAETYKIHGSCEAAGSLVLTDSDYIDYQSRNSYLAAKLLTIFAEHPVMFIGYSMTDRYIRSIIDSIAQAVGPDRLDALQKQIYFVEWNENPSAIPSISPYFIEVFEGHSLPAQKISSHSLAPVFEALSMLDRPFPAHLLRELRKHVYELVAHPEPGQAVETVRAIPFESQGGEGLRVVFGVGYFTEKDLEDISSISGRTLKREDLAQDVLGVRTRGIAAHNVLQHGIPEILRYSANAYLPVFKYLRECDLIDNRGRVQFHGLPEEVKRLIERDLEPAAQNVRRYQRDVEGDLTTPREIFQSDLALYFKLDCLLCLNPDEYDLEELRQVLVEQLDHVSGNQLARTNLFKAVAYYDKLKYARL